MELIPTTHSSADDTTKTEVVIPVKTEHKYIGKLMPSPGHTCYQLNLRTRTITSAVFEEVNVSYPLNAVAAKHMNSAHIKKANKLGLRKRVIIQPDCIYCTALNSRNAIKRFLKMLQLNAAIQNIKPKTNELETI